MTSLVAVAHAEPKQDPSNPDALVAYKLEVEQGTTAFRAGMFSDARVSFERAYALYAEPVLLFNIASCYRRAGDPRSAIVAYRRFLDAAPADDHRLTLATQTIATLERELAKRAADDDIEVEVSDGADESDDGTVLRLSRASTFTIPSGSPSDASLAPSSPSPLTAPLTDHASPTPRRSRLRAYGLGIASAGAVMLVGAAVDGYRSYAIAGDLDALPRDHQWNHDDAGRYRDGERAAARARVLGLSGAAIVATGATLFVIGTRRDASAPRIEGAVGAGGGQVVLRGAF